jgi:hypothetical protein
VSKEDLETDVIGETHLSKMRTTCRCFAELESSSRRNKTREDPDDHGEDPFQRADSRISVELDQFCMLNDDAYNIRLIQVLYCTTLTVYTAVIDDRNICSNSPRGYPHNVNILPTTTSSSFPPSAIEMNSIRLFCR